MYRRSLTLHLHRQAHRGRAAVWLRPLACSIGLLALVVEAARGDDWPQFRGNPALTGVSAAKFPAKPELLWTYHAEDAVTSSAAIVGGVVLVGSDDGNLHAVDLATGKGRWKYSAGSAIQASPTVMGRAVCVGDESGVFHAVSLDGGSKLWTYKTGGQIASSANVHKGRLIFGSYDGGLYCLSASDGRLIWKFKAEDRIHGTPGITEDGHVLIAGCDQQLRVINLADGEEVRAVDMQGVSGCSAANVGARVFVGTFNNEVMAVDWKAGRRLWTFEDAERQFPFYSSAAVDEKRVVIGGRDKLVRALDRDTGKALWTFKTKGRVDSSPLIMDGRVWIGSSDGNLYALELGTGAKTWSFEAAAPISASPSAGGGRLVVGSEDGSVYCFGESAGRPAR